MAEEVKPTTEPTPPENTQDGLSTELDALSQGIEEMNSSLFSDVLASGSATTEVKPSEEPPVETPAEETPSVEPPVEEPTVDPRDQVIEDLRKRLDALENPPVEEPKDEPIKIEPKDFTRDLDLDDLMSEPAKLNDLLNKVYASAREDVSVQLTQSLPSIINRHVNTYIGLRELSNKFYSENPDLSGHDKVVASVFAELQQKDPNKPFADVLKELATAARGKLGLSPPQSHPEEKKAPAPPPPLPRKATSTVRPPESSNTNPLQSEIEEMNNSLRR